MYININENMKMKKFYDKKSGVSVVKIGPNFKMVKITQ